MLCFTLFIFTFFQTFSENNTSFINDNDKNRSKNNDARISVNNDTVRNNQFSKRTRMSENNDSFNDFNHTVRSDFNRDVVNARKGLYAIRTMKVIVLKPPIKPDIDLKTYKAIKLDNQLTALLISVPVSAPPIPEEEEQESDHRSTSYESTEEISTTTTAKPKNCKPVLIPYEEPFASCAVTVRAGRYNDPFNYQGMAVLAQHAITRLPNSKYGAGEYHAFLRNNGGTFSEETNAERATFEFRVAEKDFPTALSMLSQAFLSPKFSRLGLEEQIMVLKSEFKTSLNAEEFQGYFIGLLLPDFHPEKMARSSDKQSLEKENKNNKLVEQLKDFWYKYYSARRIKLAVQSSMNITALEQLIVSNFGPVHINDRVPNLLFGLGYKDYFITPDFKSMYYVKPKSDDERNMRLSWIVAPFYDYYKSKPLEIIAYLLEYKEKGGLLCSLKEKQWANDIRVFLRNTIIFASVSVMIDLTEAGVDNMYQVIHEVYSYLHMVKLAPESALARLFNELQAINEALFQHNSSINVKEISDDMMKYPSEYYLTGSKRFEKFVYNTVRSYYSYFRPDKMNIILISPEKNVTYDTKDYTYNIEYKEQSIPQIWVERWQNPTKNNTYALPPINPYIATDFSTIPLPDAYLDHAYYLEVDPAKIDKRTLKLKEERAESVNRVLQTNDCEVTVCYFGLDRPNLLHKGRDYELWYKPPYKPNSPTADVMVQFNTPYVLSSAMNKCMLEIWVRLVNEVVSEDLYPALRALLSYQLSVSDFGLELKFSGYSQHLLRLVIRFTQLMKSVMSKVDQALFVRVKKKYAHEYIEQNQFSYWLHNINPVFEDLLEYILVEPFLRKHDLYAATGSLSLENLKKFNDNLFNEMYLQVLVQGNIPWYKALELSRNIKKLFNIKQLNQDDFPRYKNLQLPCGSNTLHLVRLTTSKATNFVLNYYQTGVMNSRNNIANRMIVFIIKPLLNEQLRGIGYKMDCASTNIKGSLGIGIYVQSDSSNIVSEVNARIDEFVTYIVYYVNDLDKAYFQRVKQNFKRLVFDKESVIEAEANWRQILWRSYDFHREMDNLDVLEQMDLSELKDWTHKHLASDSSYYRKISIQLEGQKTDKSTAELNRFRFNYVSGTALVEGGTVNIMDIKDFKNNLTSIPNVVNDKFPIQDC